MNTDPLSDASAPRYAYESDEEEDEHNPLSAHSQNPAPSSTLDIQFKGLQDGAATNRTLLVASGEAGKFWAAGAHLGEQTGGVYVNSISVGLLFQPPWTEATVLVSEITASLPIWAMHPYAQAVLDFVTPSQIVLLDSYPVPVYVADRPLAYHDAPVRYLRTSGNTKPSPKFAPFEPPNLIQTTVAAFTSIAALSPSYDATVLLLPSPHLPRPRRPELAPSDFSQVYDIEVGWATDVLQEVHSSIFAAAGEGTPEKWTDSGVKRRHADIKRAGDVGDGGMYM